MTKIKSLWFLLRQWADDDHCTVVGAHAFILRVSSFIGLAPLRFRPHCNGYVVSISIPMCIYSYILNAGSVMLAFYGIISELKNINPFDHESSQLSQVISCCGILLLVILTSAGVYGAPWRMKRMIQLMNTISLVDKGIGWKNSQTRERKLSAGCLFIFLGFSILMADQIYNTAQETKTLNSYIEPIAHYVGFVGIWFMIVVLEMQFAITVMAVFVRFRHLNQALTITACNLAKTAVNDASPNNTVHRIAILHGKLCDVVQHLEDSYGFCLVVVLVSTLFHLIMSPYFAISEFNTRVAGGNWYHIVILHVAWYTLHLLKLFMVVEPCHYTTSEGNKTEMIVRRMMMESSEGVLASRLEIFSRQLMLQPVSYQPMGTCTLDRPLIASIFGAVATYIVILIQFRKYEN